MLLPTVVIQRGGSGTECTGELRRREPRDRAMNAMAVVVIPERLQLSLQIDRVPEEDAVQVLAPDRADQTLNERMRHTRTLVVDRADPVAVTRLQQQTQSAARAAVRSAPTVVPGDTYCLYVRSRVTGESKAHTCRWFNSYQQCQEAAERIGAWCGRPK